MHEHVHKAEKQPLTKLSKLRNIFMTVHQEIRHIRNLKVQQF